jgi:hypothetical protein
MSVAIKTEFALGGGLQGAVEAVCPGMVRADYRACISALLRAQPRTSVAADIVESRNRSILLPDD